MLHCHASQFYEWVPHTKGELDRVPAEEEARKAWLAERVRDRARHTAERFRLVLEVLYGKREGERVKFAEAFEACEYGQPLTAENRRELFPFFDDRQTVLI